MAFSDIIKKLMSDKEESDDTLPSDETSISIQNQIENKSESINSGITEIHISILRIFDSIYSVNKMSKDLNSLEKYTQKKPKKSVSRKDKVDLIPEFKASKILLFAALAVALGMLLEWITNFITGTVNTITDAINGVVNSFYDIEQDINSFVSGIERSFISGIVSSTNTILGLAYDLASSALSAYYGTLTLFSSSEKKEQVQQEIQRFKAEGVEKKKQVTLFGVTQTAAITASEETRKQEIEVSRVESITSVNAKGQEVITAITPPRLFDIFGTAKPAQSFGGGGATGNISTEPYTGPQILSGSIYDAIIAAEGTALKRNPYEESLGYRDSPKPLTQMTMRESLEWGEQIAADEMKKSNKPRREVSSAKGAFQIVNQTQKEAMEKLGIGDNELFDEQNQKRMAAYIWSRYGWRAWEGFKKHPEILASAKDFIGKKVPIPPSSGRSKSNQPIVVSKNTSPPQTVQKPNVNNTLPKGSNAQRTAAVRDHFNISDIQYSQPMDNGT
jgi:hypothetical protein